MFETRRRFSATVATVALLATVALVAGVATIVLVGSGLGAEGVVLAGQQAPLPPGMPKPPSPAEPDQDKDSSQGLDPRAAKRAELLRNEKEFREGVERLYQLSGELRDEVTQTPRMAVLSVRMYKKTEEIEKLAKLLKAKAKG